MIRLMSLLTLFGLTLSFFPLSAKAQISSGALQTQNGSELVVSPRYPEPGEKVTLTLNDYSINTAGAKISWFVDGQEVTAARNLRSAQITAGSLGSQTNIVVKTLLPTGITLTAQTTLKPMRIDLLVEADTLTPSFYAGRALPSSGSPVRVTAIPFTGTNRTPESYSYRWTVGDTVVGGGSQFGKNSTVFTSGFEREVVVTVDVIGTGGELIGSRSLAVPIIDPELHFYQINPLEGESQNAMMPGFIFIGDEIKVRAEPYFISRSLMQQNPFIQWKLNNQTIENPSQDKQEITLRKEGASGSFKLEFHVRNLANVLQGIKDSVNINF